MSAEYVFVLVTWNNCQACKHFFKYTWDLLKENIIQLGRINIVHVERVTKKDEDGVVSDTFVSDSVYNQGITSYVQFFPGFFMIPIDKWNASPLVIGKDNIYGVDDSLKPSPTMKMDIASLTEWIGAFVKLRPVPNISDPIRRYNINPKISRTSLNDEIL